MHIGAFPHSLSYSVTHMIGFSMMYFKVFIEIFEFKMYIQGHTVTPRPERVYSTCNCRGV